MGEKHLTLSETMENVERVFNENPEPISGVNRIYQFNIFGEEEGIFQLQLEEGKANVVAGTDAVADSTLKMSFANFHNFLAGRLNGTTAFMTGKLKIDGDVGKAIKLEQILKQYDLRQ
ncbi:SCP2 sterol-binding domain-containing protein [Lentibacillus sediminis]|uniref:SCP2 sterol-binding domain-containing protein n=1 Tax=Lentibacillus sediminis TaxID=1940529 RepID=UPI001EFE9C2F|nr:SCP2 sterol-binding domain-containing protein [Lentibacillus sediminis]